MVLSYHADFVSNSVILHIRTFMRVETVKLLGTRVFGVVDHFGQDYTLLNTMDFHIKNPCSQPHPTALALANHT